jgi:hypothetical protein
MLIGISEALTTAGERSMVSAGRSPVGLKEAGLYGGAGRNRTDA